MSAFTDDQISLMISFAEERGTEECWDEIYGMLVQQRARIQTLERERDEAKDYAMHLVDKLASKMGVTMLDVRKFMPPPWDQPTQDDKQEGQ